MLTEIADVSLAARIFSPATASMGKMCTSADETAWRLRALRVFEGEYLGGGLTAAHDFTWIEAAE